VPNSTIVKTIRAISTTTGASASGNDGRRGGVTGFPGPGDDGGSDTSAACQPLPAGQPASCWLAWM
jgi:hypothetical protein